MDDLKMPIVRKKNLISIILINLFTVAFSTFIDGYGYKQVFYNLIITAVAMVAVVLSIESIRYDSLIENADLNSYDGIKKSVLICCGVFVFCTFIPVIYIPWILFSIILYDSCRYELTLMLAMFYGLFVGMISDMGVQNTIIGCVLILMGAVVSRCGRRNLKASFIILFASSFVCECFAKTLTSGLPDIFTVIIILAVSLVSASIGTYLISKQKILTKSFPVEEEKDLPVADLNETIDYLSYIDDKYSLVKDIKNFSLSEYNHARNVSRVAASLIEEIGGDVELTKMAGFYYRLGILQGEPVIENSIKLAYDYCFPRKVINILEEHDGTKRLPQTKESAVIHMTDMCLKKAELLRSKKLSSNWNQDMVIYQTLNELSAPGIYDESGISMNQFLTIRDKMVEEGLRV